MQAKDKEQGPPHLRIDPEFESLTPAMPEKEYEALDESIRENGLLVPIVVTQDHVIVDGHHRWRACKELGIEPRYVTKYFETRDDAKCYIITANLHRRHLNSFQRIELAYKDLEIEAEKAHKRRLAMLKRGNNSPPLDQNQPIGEKGRVYEILARRIGLGRETVKKGCYLIENPSEAVKEKLRNGGLSIDRAYSQLVAVKKETPRPKSLSQN